jgi:hypothetical protein
MRKPLLSIAVVAALAAGALVAPALSASAAPTTTLILTLVTPAGADVGSGVDAAGSIELFDDSGFDYYYAPAPDPTSFPDSTYVTSLTNGKAVFYNVPLGDALSVFTNAGPNYINTYSDFTLSNSSSSLVQKSLHVAKGGSISGTLTTKSGSPLAGALVSALDKNGYAWTAVETDSAGKYSLQGLFSGHYRVQFNTRATTGGYANDNFAWNYWKASATWGGSDPITIYKQGKTSSATVKKKVNDVVPTGHSLTIICNLNTTPNQYASAEVFLEAVGTPDSLSVYLDPTGTNVKTKLIKGKYRIGVVRGSHIHWYTGDGKKTTTKSAAAKVYSFAGSQNKHITIGK